MDDGVTESCPVASRCGGCALIGQGYASQLDHKARVVREALAAAADTVDVKVEECLPAPLRLAYRNRAKLAVAATGAEVRAGLYRRGTNEIVDLDPCRVQSERSLVFLAEVKESLGRHGLARPQGPVKYVDVREAAGGRFHLTLVVELDAHGPLPPSMERLATEIPRLCGLAVNFSPSRSSYVFGPTTRTLWGARSFLASVPGPGGQEVVFEVPATGFFQVAVRQLAAIHGVMAGHLGSNGPLYDLYCGVGVHALMLAARSTTGGEPIVGIEENASSCACARRNADRLGVAARFHTGRVEKVLDGVLPRRPGVRIVMNPGRPGCRPEVLKALDACRAARMAYLSCNPETLARDLAELKRRGWAVSRVLPVDMMPQTDQVEALALMARNRVG